MFFLYVYFFLDKRGYWFCFDCFYFFSKNGMSVWSASCMCIFSDLTIWHWIIHWHVLLWGRLFLGLSVFLSLRLGLRPSMLSAIHVNVFIVAILVQVLFREPILIVLDQGHSVTSETIKSFPKTSKCLVTLERAFLGIWMALDIPSSSWSVGSLLSWCFGRVVAMTSLPVTTTVLCTKRSVPFKHETRTFPSEHANLPISIRMKTKHLCSE